MSNIHSCSLFAFYNLPAVCAGERLNQFFIGPESDHWECLSVTDSLTNCHLVNLIDVTLACEDANSKLVEVITVADVADEM